MYLKVTKKVRKRELERERAIARRKEQDGEQLRKNLTEDKCKIYWAHANERESERQSKKKRARGRERSREQEGVEGGRKEGREMERENMYECLYIYTHISKLVRNCALKYTYSIQICIGTHTYTQFC